MGVRLARLPSNQLVPLTSHVAGFALFNDDSQLWDIPSRNLRDLFVLATDVCCPLKRILARCHGKECLSDVRILPAASLAIQSPPGAPA